MVMVKYIYKDEVQWCYCRQEGYPAIKNMLNHLSGDKQDNQPAVFTWNIVIKWKMCACVEVVG